MVYIKCKEGDGMYIINETEQLAIRMQIVQKRMTRQQFSKAIGISMPTVKKILDNDCPFVISKNTAGRIKLWKKGV